MADIYFYDNGEMIKPKNEEDSKLTPDVLRSKISSMDIFADVNILSSSRGQVTVHKNMGTTCFLANGTDNLAWLQFNCVSKRETATTFVYNFVFD